VWRCSDRFLNEDTLLLFIIQTKMLLRIKVIITLNVWRLVLDVFVDPHDDDTLQRVYHLKTN